jgi:hypothetical protein
VVASETADTALWTLSLLMFLTGGFLTFDGIAFFSTEF